MSYDDTNKNNMDSVGQAVLASVHNVLAGAATIIHQTIDAANAKIWGDQFAAFRNMTQPTQTNAEVLEMIAGRPQSNDEEELDLLRVTEASTVLGHFLGVLTLAAMDQLAHEQGAGDGQAIDVELHRLMEVLSDKLLILSRIVASTYVRAIFTDDGVTAVTPEVIL